MGQPFDTGVMDAAMTAMVEHLNPPSDFKGSSEYRREMAAVLTRRTLLEAWGKLTQEASG
jgi:carbon-monoxide dehydrogenase medium subunit